MQTANQSLASLYMKRLITLETALAASSNKDELQDMINRGVGRRGRAPGLGRAPGSGTAAGRRHGTWLEQEVSSCQLLHIRDGRAQGRRSAASASPTRWTPPIAALRREQIMVTRITPAKVKAEAAPKDEGRQDRQEGRRRRTSPSSRGSSP